MIVQTVSIKHGLQTADYGLGIKRGLSITDSVQNTDSDDSCMNSRRQ